MQPRTSGIGSDHSTNSATTSTPNWNLGQIDSPIWRPIECTAYISNISINTKAQYLSSIHISTYNGSAQYQTNNYSNSIKLHLKYCVLMQPKIVNDFQERHILVYLSSLSKMSYFIY